jgi:hypothetical protein
LHFEFGKSAIGEPIYDLEDLGLVPRGKGGALTAELAASGHPGLKPPDAIHLATACIANVEEFHTFDDRLLALNGVIDRLEGTRLVIKKPAVPAPPAPLLDEIERGRGKR